MEMTTLNSTHDEIAEATRGCFEYNQHFVAMMNIINHARLTNIEGKFEKHHTVPRCYYKKINKAVDNNEYNLVNLTIEEHKHVHKLAVLCAKVFIKASLQHAYNCMYNFPRGLNCKWSEETKKKISEKLKKKGIRPPSRKGCTPANKGKKLTDEQRKLISERTKQAMKKEEIRKKCGWNRGLTKETDKRVAALANNLKGRTPCNKKEKL